MRIEGVTVLPYSAIVLLSFLAIVRAAVGFNSLDATELFLFSVTDQLRWPCGVLIQSCFGHQSTSCWHISNDSCIYNTSELVLICCQQYQGLSCPRQGLAF